MDRPRLDVCCYLDPVIHNLPDEIVYYRTWLLDAPSQCVVSQYILMENEYTHRCIRIDCAHKVSEKETLRPVRCQILASTFETMASERENFGALSLVSHVLLENYNQW